MSIQSALLEAYCNFCLDELSSLSLAVQNLVIGINYTVVVLEDGSIGVAYTNVQDGRKSCSNLLSSGGYLSERPLSELFAFSLSSMSWRKSIGLAALNAFSQSRLRNDPRLNFNDDILSTFLVKTGQKIGFVGYIRPTIASLTKLGAKVTFLDSHVKTSSLKGVTIAKDIEDLKDAEHLILTGSSLLYPDIDDLFSLLSTIRGSKILLGPTAEVLPEPFFERGITAIGSSQFFDAFNILKSVQQGAGYRFFKKFGRKYIIKAEK